MPPRALPSPAWPRAGAEGSTAQEKGRCSAERSETGGGAGQWASPPPRGPAPGIPGPGALAWQVRRERRPRGAGAPAVPGGAHAAAPRPARPG